MDTLYYRRDRGCMVFRDAYQHQNLYWQYVNYETIALYRRGVEHLNHQGWTIKGIVCDGRRGLLQAFAPLPVQLCHFHQQAIITRYLTQNPRLEASKQLQQISRCLGTVNQEEWCDSLQHWQAKWEDFLKEKTYNHLTHRWHYTHRRLRSAFRSLNTNTPFLFTYLKYPELKIPNTTNSLEGHFSNLRAKLRNHPGLKMNRKLKLSDYILSR